MQKDFCELFSALFAVCLQRSFEEILRVLPIQVALLLGGREPWSEFAFKHNAITGIEEHLSGAASRSWIRAPCTPKCQTYIADSFPRR